MNHENYIRPCDGHPGACPRVPQCGHDCGFNNAGQEHLTRAEPVRHPYADYIDMRAMKELPIVMQDDGFFETIDDFVIALRWPILAFAVMSMSLFIVAMIYF